MACSSGAPSWSWARSPRPAELGASTVAGADAQPRPDDVDDEHDQVQRRVHLKRQPTGVPRCRARRGQSRTVSVSARAACSCCKSRTGDRPPSAADAFLKHKTKSCSSSLAGCQTKNSDGVLRRGRQGRRCTVGKHKAAAQAKPGRQRILTAFPTGTFQLRCPPRAPGAPLSFKPAATLIMLADSWQ